MNPVPPLMIKAIKQKDNFRFTIDWSDGLSADYQLCELQRQCPCSKCYEKKGRKVPDDLTAKRIVNVGRYALRIEFSSGCSSGIYSFLMLRKIMGNNHA